MSQALQFGVFFFCGVEMPDAGVGGTPPQDRRYRQNDVLKVYADLEAYAQAADRLGFTSMWLAEHHFQFEGYEVVPNAILMSAFRAARTSTLKFGAMFTDPDELARGMHAGDSETSWVLALAPELVHMDLAGEVGDYPRVPEGIRHLRVRGPVGYSWLTAELSTRGVIGNPRGASAETGHAYIEATVEKLAGVLEEIASFEMATPAGADTKA